MASYGQGLSDDSDDDFQVVPGPPPRYSTDDEARAARLAARGGPRAVAVPPRAPEVPEVGDVDAAAPAADLEATMLGTVSTPQRKHIVAVVDLSLSMKAKSTVGGLEVPFTNAEMVTAMAAAIPAFLSHDDHFSLVQFSDWGAIVMNGEQRAAPIDVYDRLGAIRLGGSTNLSSGFDRAMDCVKTLYAANPAVPINHHIILLTDGDANNGVTRDLDRYVQAAVGGCAPELAAHLLVSTVAFGPAAPEQLYKMSQVSGCFANATDVTSLGTIAGHFVGIAHALDHVEQGDLIIPHRPVIVLKGRDTVGELVTNAQQAAAIFESIAMGRLGRSLGRLAPFVDNPDLVPGLAEDINIEVDQGLDAKNWSRWGRAYLFQLASQLQNRLAYNHFDRAAKAFRLAHPDFSEMVELCSTMYDQLGPPQHRDIDGFSDRTYSHGAPRVDSLAMVNDPLGGCVHGLSYIQKLDPASGDEPDYIPTMAQDIEPGDKVLGYSPTGELVDVTIARILRFENHKPVPMVALRITEAPRFNPPLLITPWHPVVHKGEYVFPRNLVPPDEFPEMVDCKVMVSFEAEECDAPAIDVNGVPVLNLNAQVPDDPVATNPFWGTSQWREGLGNNRTMVFYTGVDDLPAPLIRDPEGNPAGWRVQQMGSGATAPFGLRA